jgi:hypothetical protein
MIFGSNVEYLALLILIIGLFRFKEFFNSCLVSLIITLGKAILGFFFAFVNLEHFIPPIPLTAK